VTCKKYKITIDLTYTLTQKTGIGAFAYYFAKSLIFSATNSINQHIFYYLFYNCIKPERYDYLFKNEQLLTNCKNIFFRTPRRFLNLLWTQDFINTDFILKKPDIFLTTGLHCPNALKAQQISIIYDVSFMVDDITYNQVEKKKLYLLIEKLIKKSRHIITTSKSTAIDLQNFFGCSADKISVIYGGLPEIPEIFRSQNISDELINNLSAANTRLYNFTISKETLQKIKENKYLLFVGAIERRKNISLILKALNHLKTNGLKIPLLLVGKPANDFENILKLTDAYNLKDQILFAGYVSDIDKYILYNNCLIVLYPSIYEGFGFPILEAFYFDKPLITTKVGSIPELAADLAFYISKDNYLELAETINKILTTEMETTYKAKRAEHLKKFDWQKTADKTFEIIEKFL